MKFIFFSPENFRKIPLRKVGGIGYGSELISCMQVLMGIQSDIQNKNSYRPHVRSEAGYDITHSSVVIKTTDECEM